MTKPLKRRYAVTAVFAALTSIAIECSAQAIAAQPPTAGSAPVTVVNTPLPVQGTVTVQGTVSVTAGEPVNARNTVTGTTNQTDNFVYTIPAGKRLIIDYVSARATVQAGESVSGIFISFPVVHFFVVVSQGPDIGGENVFTAAQSLRVVLGPFAEPTPIRMRMEKNVGGTTSIFAATLAGQLVEP
jgi:hypothetical protein